MKKALKKEISQMLIASISVTLNSIDEKAAQKIRKTLSKTTNQITKKFLKKIKSQPKAKTKNKGKKPTLVPVEPNLT